MARLNVAAIRSKYGLTQVQLAQKLGIPQGFLSSIENGKRSLPADKRKRLLEVCPVGDIAEYTLDDEGSDSRYSGTTAADNTANEDSNNTETIINDSAVIERLLSMIQQDRSETARVAQRDKDELRRRLEQAETRAEEYRAKFEKLTMENMRLRELCLRNGIDI